MKNMVKTAGPAAKAQAKPDIAAIVGSMKEQLAVMERKIDTLISRSSERPPERPFEIRNFQKPAQSFDRQQQRPLQFPRQENSQNQRTLHKAICADCNKSCEVPFKPSGDRPVYCKECFAKRRSGGQHHKDVRADKGPGPVALAQERHLSNSAVTAKAAKKKVRKTAKAKKTKR